MTKEQKQYKLMIMADLKIVESYYADKEKTLRLQAAYHMQQAVEKTIKLCAEIVGLNLWGHDIQNLIQYCDEYDKDIEIPKLIRDKAYVVTQWEAECRYYPSKIVRKDSIKNIYDVTVKWLEIIK